MFSRIFWGISGIIVGFLMIYKNISLVNFTGKNSWAEKVFGSGGTFTFYKIIGILVIVIAFLYLTGGLNNIVVNIKYFWF